MLWSYLNVVRAHIGVYLLAEASQALPWFSDVCKFEKRIFV